MARFHDDHSQRMRREGGRESLTKRLGISMNSLKQNGFIHRIFQPSFKGDRDVRLESFPAFEGIGILLITSLFSK